MPGMFLFTHPNYDDTGFVLIDNRAELPLFQCIHCFGVIFPAIPPQLQYMSLDPFQYHRDNCYGWERKGRQK